MAIEFTNPQRFKNSPVSGSFVTKDGKPIRLILRGVLLPFGIQSYGDKDSVVATLTREETEVRDQLTELFKKAEAYWPEVALKPVVNETAKYGDQLRINLNHETTFWHGPNEPAEKKVFENRVRADLMFDVNMVWLRGKEGGISLKMRQMKFLEVVGSSQSVTVEAPSCDL
tara:strand:- start:431 stop:943 length:513 start_codon:yes stop_codon:yes gene_type:complete